MGRRPPRRFPPFKVLSVRFVGSTVLSLTLQRPLPLKKAPQLLSQIDIVGRLLGQNIHSALPGVLVGQGSRFQGVHQLHHRCICTFEKSVRQGTKPCSPSFVGPGLLTLSERSVDVLQNVSVPGAPDLLFQFRGQQLLVFQHFQNAATALFQVRQFGVPLDYLAQLDFIQTTRPFLPVPGDKRNGCAL